MKPIDITKYLRSAVLVGNSSKVDLSKAKHLGLDILDSKIISYEENKEIIDFIHGKKTDNSGTKVILILNVIKNKHNLGNEQITKNPKMEGILHIPATLIGDVLEIPENFTIPWIPLDLLISNEYDLTIGTSSSLDKYLDENRDELYSIFANNSKSQWTDYINFAIKLCNNVLDPKLLNDNYIIEKELYIVKDETINATFNIIALYNDIIDKGKCSELYKNFISLSQLHDKRNLEFKKESHVGSMNDVHTLAISQRECLNASVQLEDGDILAVSGPPGTGKTTLLQSVIANMVVENALKESDPPIIVATSTNNKAVTNVIESFVMNKDNKSILEERWINGVNSFATFFPSSTKFTNSNGKYQETTINSKGLIGAVESNENRKLSLQLFAEKYNLFFKEEFIDLISAKNTIHKALKLVNEVQVCILELNKFNSDALNLESIMECIDHLNQKIDLKEKQMTNEKARLKQWNDMYYKISPFTRFFSKVGIKSARNKINTEIAMFCIDNEDFYSNSIDDIFQNFTDKLIQSNAEIRSIKKIREQYQAYKSKINAQNHDLKQISPMFSEYVDFNEDVIITHNDELDKTYRYLSFNLAIKYYEASWLLLEQIDSNAIEKTTTDILEQKINYLSHLTPCFVSTAYMLPRIFRGTVGKSDNNWIIEYLYEKIDLLIVDEAGQISPEILACSFALAKKALVVGDVCQIAPVYNINSILDKYLLYNVRNNNDIDILDYDINSSESSVMQVASGKHAFIEELMLKEHRRCYDQIISFNNELIYGGNLLPCRPKHPEPQKLPLPYIGYVKVECSSSKRVLTSRQNREESVAIVNWLEDNYNHVTNNGDKSIGIITPFKTQANLIRKLVNQSSAIIDYNKIEVGTVHTFQGDEKDIILFSVTYGSEENCSFLDSNRSILNVAVSRAKDHFIVFTSFDCLAKDASVPTGLLRNYIHNHEVKL